MPIVAIQREDGTFVFKGRSVNITKDKNIALKPFGKQLLNYGIILDLLPTDINKKDINQQIGNARFLSNRYFDDRKSFYDKNKNILDVSTYKKDYLPKLKEEFSFLKLSDKFALEDAIERMDIAYKNFYKAHKEGKVKVIEKGKRKGQLTHFPQYVSKYKSNGNCYTTKFTNNNIELIEVNNIPYIKLPKIGKIELSLPKDKTLDNLLLKGTRITSATIRRNSCNIDKNTKYTVSLQLETVIDEIKLIENIDEKTIYACDMGIKDFAIYGNKDTTIYEENPHWIRKHEKRLRRLQRSLSRKQYDVETKKGSKNYYKLKSKIAKEHRKLKNQRKDFQHKLSRKIVNECNVFICEDLNIQGMVKNKHLSKAINSVGWGQFLTFVKYKLERKGGYFLKVDRFFPSSKLCSNSKCDYKHEELTLKVREWICPKCGIVHNRDENAKNNLINEGIRLLTTNPNYKVCIT